MNTSLKEFQSQVMSKGLAKPTRFEVMIPLPAIVSSSFNDGNRLLALYCETASLPPHIVGVRPQRIYGPLYQRPFGVEYGGEGLTMTFLVDKNMSVKALFDYWIGNIVDPTEYYVHYEKDYVTNINIRQLDEGNNSVSPNLRGKSSKSVYLATLEKAFPRSINLLELNSAAQNQFHKLQVNFAYRRWSFAQGGRALPYIASESRETVSFASAAAVSAAPKETQKQSQFDPGIQFDDVGLPINPPGP